MVQQADPFIGTMTPATRSDEASYLDFVEGVRTFNLQKVQPKLAGRYADAARAFEQTHGRPIRSLDDSKAALDSIPIFASRNRLWRTGQEMMWTTIIDSYRAREAELLAELDRADRSGPGSVRYDPSFVYPDYVTRAEIHIQPGSYDRDPLAGYIYHYGTKIFFTGQNNVDELQRSQVLAAPLPADDRVNRVLDLGCSVGQSATAWQERFPQAEVWAIDIAAPMIRYAHKRAVEMGLPVHFAQMASERLEFPNGHFDVVHAYILFHELPVPVIRQTIREAARVLRPGGVFVIYDFNGRTESPLSEYLLDFTVADNGEPYAWEFCHLDFPAELRAGGFREAVETRAGGRVVTIATR